MEREDSREVEEEGEVNLPLTVFPPFKHTSKPTPSDVMARVLNQLFPVEGVAEFGKSKGRDDLATVNEERDGGDVSKAVDRPISPFEPEPAKEEEIISPLPPE